LLRRFEKEEKKKKKKEGKKEEKLSAFQRQIPQKIQQKIYLEYTKKIYIYV